MIAAARLARQVRRRAETRHHVLSAFITGADGRQVARCARDGRYAWYHPETGETGGSALQARCKARCTAR